jgi:hypothetical protein
MRSPSVWLTAFSVLLLAACGGRENQRAEPPKLNAALAQQLAAETDRIADEVTVDGCRARTDLDRLRRRVATIEQPFRRPLLNSIDRITAEVPCQVVPATTGATTTDEEQDEGHGKGHGKGGKHGKKKGHED